MVSGTVFHISRYSIHDGPGIRTTVFFKGCPLNCWWCHNPESISPRPEICLRPQLCIRCGRCVRTCPNGAVSLPPAGAARNDPSRCRLCLACTDVCCADAREAVGRIMTVEEVMEAIERDVPFFDESGGGATFSGGEPMAQPAFLLALLEECGLRDLHRTVDTSGFAAEEVMEKVADRTDLFLYDLKLMDPERHKRYTGVDNESILRNLGLLAARGAAVRVRMPVVPGINDDAENIEATGTFLKALPGVDRIDLLPYHDVAGGKYRRFGYSCRLDETAVPDSAHMRKIAERLGRHGLRVTIGGEDHERTYPQAQTVER